MAQSHEVIPEFTLNFLPGCVKFRLIPPALFVKSMGILTNTSRFSYQNREVFNNNMRSHIENDPTTYNSNSWLQPVASFYPPSSIAFASQPMVQQCGYQPARPFKNPDAAGVDLPPTQSDLDFIYDPSLPVPSYLSTPDYDMSSARFQSLQRMTPQPRPSCQQPEVASPPQQLKKRLSRRKDTKTHQKPAAKPIARSNIKKQKREKGPRTFCKMPGCAQSVSRSIDIPRHMKAAHGREEDYFQCLLCLGGNSQKKPKDTWRFPLKYNLTE